MKFYTIESFDLQVKTLIKNKKDGYSSCKKDINTFFRNKTMEQLAIVPTTLEYITQNTLLKKSRVKNSFAKIGASGGYRIIYVANMKKNEIYLLYIYPKRGKHGQIDISDNAKLLLTKRLLKAFENNTLNQISIENYK